MLALLIGDGWIITALLLGTAVCFCLLGYAAGKKDGMESADAQIAVLQDRIGPRVEVVAKRSKDYRWRLSVEPWSVGAENATDWISCGDGFRTVTQAEELARFYWPDCKFTIDDGEPEDD